MGLTYKIYYMSYFFKYIPITKFSFFPVLRYEKYFSGSSKVHSEEISIFFSLIQNSSASLTQLALTSSKYFQGVFEILRKSSSKNFATSSPTS